MDELRLLCTQELMEEMMNTVSSSDEDENEEQMDMLTYLCAQNLMDDLLDSSSSPSSDEDDEFFAVLGYTHLLERSEALSKYKANNTVTTHNNQEQTNPKVEINNSLESGKNIRKDSATKKSTNKAEETNFANCIPNLTAEYDGKRLLKESEMYVRTNETNENTVEDVLSPLTKCDFKSTKDKAEHLILSPCNLQFPLHEGIIDSLSENGFKECFHINRDSLTYLMDRFSSWCSKGSYKQTNIKATILTFLWFCANPVSFESVTQIFNVSLTDSKESLNIILDFFEKELSSEMIKLPTTYVEKETIAKDFEKIDGFPNVLGCLAVSYISLKTPELIQICGGTQLHLRSVFDANRKFLNIKIAFSKETENDTFLEKDLPKLCFPKYHLLGDTTCLIRDHLVIPYESTENLGEPETYFNAKLLRTHVKTKEAFASLRNRFRQLQYLDFDNIETLSKFIMACCIFHNICIDRHDFYDETYKDESYGQFDSYFSTAQCDDFLQDLGLMKRYELTQILFRTKK